MLDSTTFKEAMSSFASGVTIVTMKGTDDGYHGLTVSSFTSVSLDPPLVLFCRKKIETGHKALVTGDTVVINVLSQEQQALAYQFADPKLDSEARFQNVDFELYEDVPVLSGNKCSIVSKIADYYEAGDHTIFICEAVHTEIDPERSPLVYYKRGFHDLLSPATV